MRRRPGAPPQCSSGLEPLVGGALQKGALARTAARWHMDGPRGVVKLPAGPAERRQEQPNHHPPPGRQKGCPRLKASNPG